MPSTLSYPGVYIEEIPSGVRTITGVATAITAFVGRALRGPVNEAVVINSYGDYERVFGGLWLDSSMSYAVRDFFLNGGGQAVIVRLFAPTTLEQQNAFTAAQAQAQTAAQLILDAFDAALLAALPATTDADIAAAAGAAEIAAAGAPGPAALSAATAVAQAGKDEVNATPSNAAGDRTAVRAAAAAAVPAAVAAAAAAAAPTTKAQLSTGGTTPLNLEAAYEGLWGNRLRTHVDYDVKGGVGETNLFNLSVKDMGTGQTEVHRNVSVQATHPRRIDKVLTNESQLIRTLGTLPATRPSANPPAGTTTIPAGIVPVGADPFTGVDTTVAPTPPPFYSEVANAGRSSDGRALVAGDYDPIGGEADKRGIYALLKADLFNILCLPPPDTSGDLDPALIPVAAAFCLKKRAMLVIDPPSGAKTVAGAINAITAINPVSKNAAVYFPRLRQANPLRDNQLEEFVPCGAVAGIMSRTDATRGVWKAPAGLDATLVGVPDLSVQLTDAENGQLNPLGINCLRAMPGVGRVIWGARTTRGDDRQADEWKYIPVRRTALYIEESLYRGTQWVVFEPNDEPLWAQIRLNVGAFMQNMFRQGAFQGRSPKEAYFVKCDKETTTQNDINLGIVNILVGFAPLKPAEFVVIKLQQMAGQIEV
ncbi:MAG: phage tail sheath family protein [Pyrinomonadaceae bacterium]